MGLVHYLILAGAVLLVIAAVFPSFGSKAVAAVRQSKPNAPLRTAFKELHDIAEGLAYQRIEAEIADRRAGKLKAEIQELFAASPPPVEPEAKKSSP